MGVGCCAAASFGPADSISLGSPIRGLYSLQVAGRQDLRGSVFGRWAPGVGWTLHGRWALGVGRWVGVGPVGVGRSVAARNGPAAPKIGRRPPRGPRDPVASSSPRCGRLRVLGVGWASGVGRWVGAGPPPGSSSSFSSPLFLLPSPPLSSPLPPSLSLPPSLHAPPGPQAPAPLDPTSACNRHQVPRKRPRTPPHRGKCAGVGRDRRGAAENFFLGVGF